VIEDDNPGVQERPAPVRRNPKMQAPLRKGKKEETLGRAKGVKRTSRSLLFGLMLVAIGSAASLAYTWERLVVEAMSQENLALETRLDLIRKHNRRLSCEVAALESMERLNRLARERLNMAELDWSNVVVIETVRSAAK